MAETKDKVVTAESLKALHDYNQIALKDLNDKADGIRIITDELTNTKFDKPTDNIIPIANGGTGSSNGATGLENLFASGVTVLSSYQYGDTLPDAGVAGRIFFKKLSE